MCIYSCVSKRTWEEAKRDFLHFSTEKRLQNLLSMPLKGKAAIPQPLWDYCQAALDSPDLANREHPSTTLTKNGQTAHFIAGNYLTITLQKMNKDITNCHGAQLIVENLKKV